LAYITQKLTDKSILLIVHGQCKDENGRTMGFVNVGYVNL